MQQALFFLAGLILVAVVSLDVLHTTIHVGGSGMLTRRFSVLLWRLTPKHERCLHLAGPIILIVTVVMWFLLFWLGWCLIFAAGTWPVVSDPDGTRADVFSLVYYVGFSIITLGVGDYAPNGPVWQILTVLAAASGFFIVTLVITYLLPLVSAVVEQRQLASYIHSLGKNPNRLLEQNWNGKDYNDLTSHLTSLAPMLHRQTYLHLAYPILHYFRSEDRHSGIAPAIAVLDDSLTLFLYAVPEHQRPPSSALGPVRCAIWQLLETLNAAHVVTVDSPPPPLGLRGDALELPEDVEKRRRLLNGWLSDQGWSYSGSAQG